MNEQAKQLVVVATCDSRTVMQIEKTMINDRFRVSKVLQSFVKISRSKYL